MARPRRVTRSDPDLDRECRGMHARHALQRLWFHMGAMDDENPVDYSAFQRIDDGHELHAHALAVYEELGHEYPWDYGPSLEGWTGWTDAERAAHDARVLNERAVVS